MSFSVSGTTITMTRGDTAKFQVRIEVLQTGAVYHPVEGDLIRFTAKRYISDRTPVIVKEVPASDLILVIDPDDTKKLNFGPYHYDMELVHANGEVETFIEDSILEITPEVS